MALCRFLRLGLCGGRGNVRRFDRGRFDVTGALFVVQRGAGVRCGRRGRRSVRCAGQTCIGVIVRELYDGDYRLPLCGFGCFGRCLCSRGLLRCGWSVGNICAIFLWCFYALLHGTVCSYCVHRLPDGIACLTGSILRQSFCLLHRTGDIPLFLLLSCYCVRGFGGGSDRGIARLFVLRSSGCFR